MLFVEEFGLTLTVLPSGVVYVDFGGAVAFWLSTYMRRLLSCLAASDLSEFVLIEVFGLRLVESFEVDGLLLGGTEGELNLLDGLLLLLGGGVLGELNLLDGLLLLGGLLLGGLLLGELNLLDGLLLEELGLLDLEELELGLLLLEPAGFLL